MAVTDEAIEKIKGMIVSGALRPGDRLPKESELAAELGLSRNSLREAVRALSLIRILDVRQGDGTYVTSLDPQLLLEALSFVVDFHRDDTVLEFLAVRRILEAGSHGDGGSADRGFRTGRAGRPAGRTGCRPLGGGAGHAAIWSSTAGSSRRPGTPSCARCWTGSPGRPPGPGSGAG